MAEKRTLQRGSPRQVLTLLFLFGACSLTAHAADTVVYADALASGWANWSWDSTVDFSSTSPAPKSGSGALAVTYTAGWAGLYLHAPAAIDATQVAALQFQVNGGSGGQHVRVYIYDGIGNGVGNGHDLTLAANTWTSITLPMSALGGPATIGGLVWQEYSGSAQPTFSLDDIKLIAGSSTPSPTPTPTPAPTPGTGITLSVNAAAGRHAINPLIYGMNFADEGLAAELKLPVRRWGGNSTSRYNYLYDTSNHASDWFFENIPEDNSNPGALPNGSSVDHFVDQDRRTGTKTILTMPLIGWTPKNRAFAAGFSVAKYGAQQQVDPYRNDMGNGLHTNGSPITGNDPADTSIATTPAFVTGWINHLIGLYGTAANGGVAFYNLDNEPALWNSTHRDVHPSGTSYDEMKNQTYLYGAAIKAADPGAATLGPVEWGWTGYFYSGLDAAPGGSWWNNPLDRNAHGGTPFVDWYLQQMKSYEQAHGTRILDYLDLHFYPQESGVSLSGAGNAATQALRLRSTRSLWDLNYTDESWINDKIRMIPRMHDWVTNNYPGTKLAITEYNWGALDNINGALAEADVLGIFGREGLDLATLWSPPTSAQPGAYAFRIYRNYDGAGSAFGETAIQAASTDQATLSVYAAQRAADQALTLVVINKSGADQTTMLTLSGFIPSSKASIYRYSAASLTSIAHQPDQTVSPSGFTMSYPANSITLVVLQPMRTAAARHWSGY